MTQESGKPAAKGGARLATVTPIEIPRTLSEAHRAELRTSGLTDETIALSGAFTCTDRKWLAHALNWKGCSEAMVPALIFPVVYPDGAPKGREFRAKPASPRPDKKKLGKFIKYEGVKDRPGVVYFPPRTRASLRDVTKPLVWTEGEKKALALDQLGFTVVGGCGVDMFHNVAHYRETKDRRLHPDVLAHATIEGRHHFIIFDSDAETKDEVMEAARRLTGMLEHHGAASVRFVPVPHLDGGKKCGIDDYFFAKGGDAVRALFDRHVYIAAIPANDPLVPLRDIKPLESAPIDKKLRLPYGYKVDRHGQIIEVKNEGSEGEKEEIVCVRPLLIRRLLVDHRTNRETVELVFSRETSWRTVVFDRAVICSARRIVDELAAVGAPVDSGNANAVVTWFRNLESANELRIERTRCSTRCGWHTFEGERTFLLGSESIGDAEKPEKLLSFDDRAHHGRLAASMIAKGDFEKHALALRTAVAEDRIAATAIYAALAAPLLDVVGAPGFAVHMSGDSSRGKSSMLKIAASIFGDPQSSDWVAKWDSTHVGLEQRAAALCDLPIFLDESSVVPREQAQSSVYMLIDGTGRTRGARTGGTRETATWRTVVLSTGERALVDEEANTGAQVRVLTLEVTGFGSLDAAGVDALRRACGENFGEVGKRWIKSLVESDPANLRKAYRDIVAGALARVKGSQRNLDARRIDFIAVLALAEALAHRVLGFGHATGASMLSWLDERASEKRHVVDTLADRALDVAREIFHTQRRAFGTVSINLSGQEELISGSATSMMGYRDPRGDGTIHFIPGPLKDYLQKHGIDGAAALREWARLGKTKSNENARGTNRVVLGGTRLRLVTFDWPVFADANELGGMLWGGTS